MMYHLQVKLKINQSVKLFVEWMAQIGRVFSTIFRQSRQVNAQCNILNRTQTFEFGNNTIIFEKFKKKMFDIMCHMIGFNDSSG